MKLPNGYGSVKKQSVNRRKPYIVRITIGWEIDPVTKKKKKKYAVIGYAETKKEGLQMLAEYHQNPFDTNAARTTFQEIVSPTDIAFRFPSYKRSSVVFFPVLIMCSGESVKFIYFLDQELLQLLFIW